LFGGYTSGPPLIGEGEGTREKQMERKGREWRKGRARKGEGIGNEGVWGIQDQPIQKSWLRQ
jgi:hypothetical protein